MRTLTVIDRLGATHEFPGDYTWEWHKEYIEYDRFHDEAITREHQLDQREKYATLLIFSDTYDSQWTEDVKEGWFNSRTERVYHSRRLP